MFLHREKLLIRKTPYRKIEVRDDHCVDYEDDLLEMIDDAQYESNVDPIKVQYLYSVIFLYWLHKQNKFFISMVLLIPNA